MKPLLSLPARAALAATAITLLTAGHSPPTAIALDTQPATLDGTRFGPEQVFVGDYVTGAGVFTPKGSADRLWLKGWRGDTAAAHTYRLRFVGRRVAAPGHFGQGGTLTYEVILTRLVEAHLRS